MDDIKAASVSDLLQILRRTNILVPPRTKGRTTKQCETRIICHFLTAISKTALLEYPLQIKHIDRPDFELCMPSGSIGIEVVEAVSEKIAREDAYREHKGITATIEATNRPPCMGDSREQNWIKAILDCSQKKADTFQKSGFRKYDNNWLLIYDNLSPAPQHERIDREGLGKQVFGPNWENPFERVFILIDDPEAAVWKFSNKTIPVGYPSLDLWREVRSRSGLETSRIVN